MFAVDRPTAAAVKPAPRPAGTPGWFTAGDPGGGVDPTTPGYEWFNAVQDELLAILSAAGVTPVKGTDNQVLASLGVLFGGGGTLATNGWQRLPGGLLMQWGLATLPATGLTSSSVAVTFPLFFPAATYVAFGTASRGASSSAGYPPAISTGSLTQSGFALAGDILGGNGGSVIFNQGVPTSWLALGR